METWGLVVFAVVFLLWDKIRRLERILRENDIRRGGLGALAGQLREWAGRTVAITLYEDSGTTTTFCKVLEVDEEWVHVIRNEGKKNQREMLLRLSDVKQVKP